MFHLWHARCHCLPTRDRTPYFLSWHLWLIALLFAHLLVIYSPRIIAFRLFNFSRRFTMDTHTRSNGSIRWRYYAHLSPLPRRLRDLPIICNIDCKTKTNLTIIRSDDEYWLKLTGPNAMFISMNTYSICSMTACQTGAQSA